MALDEQRLKGKIKAAFEAEQIEEQSHEESLNRIAEKLAKAIIEEIKELKITYTVGLTAPNGTVTGIFTYQLS